MMLSRLIKKMKERKRSEELSIDLFGMHRTNDIHGNDILTTILIKDQTTTAKEF